MIFGIIRVYWHPAGVRVLFDRFPEVSLRSTPGYLLSSLRDEKPCFHSEMVLDFPPPQGLNPRHQKSWGVAQG